MSLKIHKDGRAVASVEDWFRLAPPKEGLNHWVDGRSAKELAKMFLESGTPGVPGEIRQLLSSRPELGEVMLSTAIPEHKIRLDGFPGEPRNADLAALGDGSVGRVAVTIEAKADEPFGDTIAKELNSAQPRSNVPNRIEELTGAMFGRWGPDLAPLRYQLLHGSAATLIYAKEHAAAAAVFVVLEFCGPSCKPENLGRNQKDLEAFLRKLNPEIPPLEAGKLLGPFNVPGGEYVPSGVPLYVGKAVRTVTAPGSA